MSRFKTWRIQRQRIRFDRRCDRLYIPRDIRERIWNAGLRRGPDWYAGRQNPNQF